MPAPRRPPPPRREQSASGRDPAGDGVSLGPMAPAGQAGEAKRHRRSPPEVHPAPSSRRVLLGSLQRRASMAIRRASRLSAPGQTRPPSQVPEQNGSQPPRCRRLPLRRHLGPRGRAAAAQESALAASPKPARRRSGEHPSPSEARGCRPQSRRGRPKHRSHGACDPQDPSRAVGRPSRRDSGRARDSPPQRAGSPRSHA